MNYKIAVKGIIRRSDDKILLVKRSEEDSFWPGYWGTVGGGMKKKESPQSALLREVEEETDLNVKVRESFNIFNFENEKGEFKVGITFICDYESGEVRLSEEHVDFAWIDPLNIKKYKTSEGLLNEIVTYANKYSKSYGKFNVSQKAVIIRDNKCFIAEITKRPGIWDLPGGRIDQRENLQDAFKREMKEETGISDFEILATYDCDTWLSLAGAAVYGTASLVYTNKDVVISQEHTQGKWITESEVDDYKYIWPAMNRMIKRGFWYYNLLNKAEK